MTLATVNCCTSESSDSSLFQQTHPEHKRFDKQQMLQVIVTLTEHYPSTPDGVV